MSKQKRKKNNKGGGGQRRTSLRLSQCMIVKNEEENIERALSWAKGLAFEQIVVDTGSTDRTVEIAESMGAKVYHFEWIDDFSAAKNYAIEQATGNWIAFLDADEYFLPEDVELLRGILNNPAFYNDYHVLRCSIVNLDDEGNADTVFEHERVYRNLPYLRYSGRIHEILPVFDKALVRPELRIMHTGYAKSVLKARGKSARNVSMIRREWEDNPDDPNLMIYMADALRIDPNPEEAARAEEMYLRAIEKGGYILQQLEQSAYDYLIPRFTESTDKTEKAAELCQKAMATFPSNPDFVYFYGKLLKKGGNYHAAWEQFKKSEEMLNAEHIPQSTVVVGEPVLLFAEMAQTAQALGDKKGEIHYATLILKHDRHQQGTLTPYLSRLREAGVPNDEILSLLSKIYDFTSVKDKVFLLRCAKNAEDRELITKLMELITPEDRAWLAGGGA